MSVDDGAITSAKSLLRQAIRRRRDGRAPSARTADDHARSAVLRDAVRELAPHRVAGYLSVGAEPDTREVVAWLDGLGVAQIMPVLSTETGERRPEPAWARYGGDEQLRAGWRSMPEPVGPVLAADAVRAADLVLCPGLAGSLNGGRLGRGGGWYDRVLITASAPVWLLLNDDEVLDDVPQHGWDLPVTALVTPTRFLRCRLD